MLLRPFCLKAVLYVLVLAFIVAGPAAINGQEFPSPPAAQAGNGVRVRIPHSKAVGLRKNASVFMLGEQVGKVSGIDYANDGRNVEVALDIQPAYAAKIVRSSRAVFSSSDQGIGLEIIRTSDLLGLNAEPAAGHLQVTTVFSGSPADLAGVAAGDKLLSIDGKPIKSMAALASANAGLADGEAIKIKISRGNKPQTLAATADRDAGLAPLGGGEMLMMSGSVPAAVGNGNSMAAVSDTVTEAGEFLTHIGADADILMTNLKDLTDNANKMMEKLQGEMEYVPGTMMEVREMMKNAGEMVEKFQGATSNIDGMMSQASSTMCQVNEMVSGVRNTRIMKTIVNRNQRSSGGGQRRGMMARRR